MRKKFEIQSPNKTGISKYKKYFQRFLINLFGLVFLIIILFFIRKYIFSPGHLEVYFLDVGQGDSELIKTPNHKLVLIDGGPDNLLLSSLGKLIPFYQKKIDYVILSHFHDDHIIGLVEIFKRYKVKNFIYINNYDSDLLKIILNLAKKNKTKVSVINSSAQVELEPKCVLKLLNPASLEVKEDQNNSVITRLDCYANSFLFSGDNSSAVEYALLKTNFDLSAQILKASHHGSKTANSEVFLRAVSPVTYVISAGFGNRFGHPAPEVVERAEAEGLNIFRTDKQGTIRISGFIQ